MDFLVDRNDLRRCRFAETPAPSAQDLRPGQTLLKVDRFALTANNITYGVFGDAMGYWSFFPGPEGWGRIPVWGFADVVASRHEAIGKGERLYGYLPISTHLVVQPDHVTNASFMDAAPHRAALPAAYQRYVRVANDPGYEARYEGHQTLFRPLFGTAFLLDDFLADQRLFGGKAVVLSSASSKTALGLAHLLARRRPDGAEVIGLTSPRNAAFVERVGYYDRVVTYEALASLPAELPVVSVDMAGDATVLQAVHRHFRNLRYSALVGATHWEERQGAAELPGPTPELFFAPTYLKKRTEEWGQARFESRYREAWRSFLPSVDRWLEIVHGNGPAAVEAAYREVLEGRARPEQGHVLSL